MLNIHRLLVKNWNKKQLLGKIYKRFRTEASLLEHKNHAQDCCYLIYKLRYRTLMYMYFRLMAAILDSPVTLKSWSIHSSLTVLMDADKQCGCSCWNFVAGIQDLQLELQVFPVLHPPFWFLVKNGSKLSRVGHCEQQWWLRSSRKLAKQPRIRSHRWTMLLCSSITKYTTCRLTKVNFTVPPAYGVAIWWPVGLQPVSWIFLFTLNGPWHVPVRIKKFGRGHWAIPEKPWGCSISTPAVRL